ncbi:MAG TPA: hypothetical protein VGF40_16810, partial [Thermoanaerobaculia bacterium]
KSVNTLTSSVSGRVWSVWGVSGAGVFGRLGSSPRRAAPRDATAPGFSPVSGGTTKIEPRQRRQILPPLRGLHFRNAIEPRAEARGCQICRRFAPG